MRKFVNEDSLSAFAQKIKDTFVIKDKTEAQALVLSSTYPNCVYYTSDTHCIVIGGNIYGRGEQIVASNFAFLPASEPGPGHDPTFQDTTKIYVQPDSSNPGYFKLWWYLQSESTWINGGSFQLGIPLTAEDISYDLTPTPDLGEGDVQSAIEALDGKVEQLSLDTLGQRTDGSTEDYWEDELYERLGWEKSSASIINSAHNLARVVGHTVYRIPVEEGETWKMEGMSNQSSTNASLCWAVYSVFNDTETTGNLTLSGYLRGDVSTADRTGVNATVVMPSGAKMLCVCCRDSLKSALRIYKKTSKPVMSLLDKAGRKIEGWTDNVMSTLQDGYLWRHIDVGDTMPMWSNTTLVPAVSNSFGERTIKQRGVRIDVEKGDVLVLCVCGWTDSNGIVFTDKNRVVVDVPQVGDHFMRRGLYTSPCDGYAYIQDTLYRDDNYIFKAGYKYLAEALWERMDKRTMIFNEFNRTKLDTFSINQDATTASQSFWFMSGGRPSAFYLPDSKYKFGKSYFCLVGVHIKVGADHTAGGVINHLALDGNNISIVKVYEKTFTTLNDLAGDDEGCWLFQVIHHLPHNYQTDSYAYRTLCNDCYIGLNLGSLIVGEKISIEADDVWLMRGESYVDVIEYYGKAKWFRNSGPVDGVYTFSDNIEVTDSKRLISEAHIGYDIFDRGAPPIMHSDGLKNAIKLRATMPSITGSASSKFNGNNTIFYLHDIDVSGVTTSCQYMFRNAYNMRTVPDLNFGNIAVVCENMFRECSTLCEVGDLGELKMTKLSNAFLNNYSLKRIKGTIRPKGQMTSENFIVQCLSLTHIDCIDCSELTTTGMQSAWNFFSNYTRFIPTVRYMLCKNIGTLPNFNIFTFQNLLWWGVNSYDEPDARQSMIDTLLTYSFDRVQANADAKQAAQDAGTYDEETWTNPYPTCNLYIQRYGYDQLTAEEREQITAKGYVLHRIVS